MNDDEKYMMRAIQLAYRGNEHVSPNPMVGAVIVCNNKIIGEGYHRCYGHGHAEVNAVNSVKDKSLLADSTIYVTLEPCSHYGKTPPCAKLLIDMHIKRVVVGIQDPFAKVSGRGIKMLTDAGVSVTVGVLEKECMAINSKFLTAHKHKRPYIMLKWAETRDGYIGGPNGEQVYISNATTKMLMHRERSEFDAIMVGANTVRCDNPSLTVRDWVGNNPIRVVVSLDNDLPVDCKLLVDGLKTLIFTSTLDNFCDNESVEYLSINRESSILNQILSELYRRNIISLMVEGGARLLNSFINEHLWDIARIEIGNSFIGNGICAPNVEGVLISQETHGNNTIYNLISR